LDWTWNGKRSVPASAQFEQLFYESLHFMLGSCDFRDCLVMRVAPESYTRRDFICIKTTHGTIYHESHLSQAKSSFLIYQILQNVLPSNGQCPDRVLSTFKTARPIQPYPGRLGTHIVVIAGGLPLPANLGPRLCAGCSA
jgi:hypothetical protein